MALFTLGCKVNQSETDAIADQFANSGFQSVAFDEVADVYVVNTCTVTHVADAKSRQLLRQAKRMNPNSLVVATGCYASIVRDQLPVDDVLVVRNRDKARLVDMVKQHLDSTVDAGFNDKPAILGLVHEDLSPDRARAMVKVQDGCDSACAYCIIPRARGRSRSVDPKSIIQRVARLVETGHKEVVITGVDLGSFGEDSEDVCDLGRLLELILASTDVHRLRVSSVEPGDFDVGWLGLWKDSRLCRHLHVPLQAGSDTVLNRMRRKYDTAAFASMINACREAIPDVAITTDIITGFPGETDAEFEQGLRFINLCRFDGMHVFPYSRRPGTAAANLPDHVSDSEKKHRAALLRTIAAAGRAAHVDRHVGTRQEVVWESERDGVWRGITDTNVRVFSGGDELPAHSVDERLLTAHYADGCWGELAAGCARSEFVLVAV